MIKNYDLVGRQFEFEVHNDAELTSDLIKKYGCNVDMEAVYAYYHLLEDGDHFLDIGANIGWTTVFGSMAVGKTGKVISFEPDEKNYAVLSRNVSRNNLNNVELIKQALGESEYTGHLYQSNNNFGNHILSPHYFNPDTHPDHCSVPVTTLDKFLKINQVDVTKIKLIKIDVEGSEPRVLEGGKKFFLSHRPKIILEFNPFHIKQCGSSMWDIFSFIDRYEYRPHIINDIDIYNPVYKITPLSIMDMISMSKNLMERGAYKDLLLVHSSEK